MKRMLLLAAVAAATTGCGGSATKVEPLVQHGPLGGGANEVWFYAAKGKPRSVVVFLHGLGGPTEETPENHVPWLKHLAAAGSDVIYPRYENGAYPDPFPHIDAAVAVAKARLGDPHAPLVVIGYSRGGRIALDYAAFQAAKGHEPKLVVAVYPGVNSPTERLGPLEKLDAKTKIVFMVGDHDTVVDGFGARAMLQRLRDAGFPPERVQLVGVKSRGSFDASHFSALEATPGAKAAIWKPVDRLIRSAPVRDAEPGYPVPAARWR